MTSLKVLICGGGCAGPALAYWLSKCGHQVVVVERFPSLRASGAQIDLRAQGIEIVKRMGLLDVIRTKLVDEVGFSFVDSQGRVKATIMANKSGKGAQSLTSEFEIMRGDLVRVLYDATKDNVKYVFGKKVEYHEQDEQQVMVYFSDGSSDYFDLLVGADGQGSRIRQAILTPPNTNPYKRLGVHIAYYFVPRTQDDTDTSHMYHCAGGRVIMRRSHNQEQSQVYLFLRDGSEELQSLSKAPLEQQKEFWSQRFADAGWQAPRFLGDIKTTDNFYCQEVVQVRINSWYKGRVVLLGDAAHCASPFSGMGTTGGFVGAYVLAGEINRHRDDLAQAFANYEEKLRPFVNELQKMSPTGVRLFAPETQWAIRWLCILRIPDLLARISSDEKGGWKLPDYPELYSI
ncbi:monooxygenase, putative [Talaromyces stipitatus ATCC 10500]|uniref:Monooxygenase, putative n=1 Tax=Talaromyces stipitatus (strain ATCC 10500 / CBS 375.48 / QM 6759 / NRRL 1006) TaxID=441959 RepID=B8MHF9_TALSN|nr:monooxygenase, putative [Talaromyces stipitatus ATCC 10500]EED17138.1 monooxygenase, putative [Talaromyces stipitatus ATCC 10500]